MSGLPRTLQPPGWPAPRGYANGMAAEGRIVVTGGVVGWDEHGAFAAGFAGQARQIFDNIRAILAEAGAEPRHLVRLTWYVVDLDEYRATLALRPRLRGQPGTWSISTSTGRA